MGLNITVGMPDRREKDNLERINVFNRISEKNGSAVRFDASSKPYHKPVLEFTMGSYSNMHDLRLQAAKMDVPEVTEDELYESKFIARYRNKHLIDHEDNQGFYIPVDFENTIWVEKGEDSVGSAMRLDKELDRVWPYLRSNSNLVRNKLSSEVSRAIKGRFEKQLQTILKEHDVPEVIAHEEYMWLKLKLAAQKSIQFGLPIIFH